MMPRHCVTYGYTASKSVFEKEEIVSLFHITYGYQIGHFLSFSPTSSICPTVLGTVFTSNKNGGTCFCPCLSVCLFVRVC